MHYRISFIVPTKCIALSYKMILVFPLRAMNLVLAARQASGSKLGTSLTCTALVVKHVNKQHNRFIDVLMNRTSNGSE